MRVLHYLSRWSHTLRARSHRALDCASLCEVGHFRCGDLSSAAQSRAHSWHCEIAHASLQTSIPSKRLKAIGQYLLDLARRNRCDATLVLADANARLGSVPSPMLSQCDAELENWNGSIFRLSYEEHMLSAVDTYWPQDTHGQALMIALLASTSALCECVVSIV